MDCVLYSFYLLPIVIIILSSNKGINIGKTSTSYINIWNKTRLGEIVKNNMSPQRIKAANK